MARHSLVRDRARSPPASPPLTLDSPHNRNALSSALIAELLAALAAAAADDAVRVIVLSHTGPRVLLRRRPEGDRRRVRVRPGAGRPDGRGAGRGLGAARSRSWRASAARPGPAGSASSPRPTSPSAPTAATFAFTEVRLGVIPAVISATVLPRLSPRAAAELFLTGDTFDGPARGRGRPGHGRRARRAARRDRGPLRRVAGARRAGRAGRHQATAAATRRHRRPLAEELAELTALSVSFFTSDEGREGVRAFAEKRSPAWMP